MKNKRTITLFFPTLNEIDGLKFIIPKINKNWYTNLIVIDGGSTDGTIEYCKKQKINIKIQDKPGPCAAFNEGFKSTKDDIFISFTPDGNCIPELLPILIEEINKGYDVVYMSRYLPPAKSEDDGIITGFGNWMFNKIINICFSANFTDVLGGYRAYTREAILKMKLHEMPNRNWATRKWDLLNDWQVAGTIRAAKLKLKIKELPGDEPARIGGESKISVVYNGVMIVCQIILELIIRKKF